MKVLQYKVIFLSIVLFSCNYSKIKTIKSKKYSVQNKIIIPELSVATSKNNIRTRKLPILIKNWKSKGKIAFYYKNSKNTQIKNDIKTLIWGLNRKQEHSNTIKRILLSLDDYSLSTLKETLDDYELVEKSAMIAGLMGTKAITLKNSLIKSSINKKFTLSARLACIIALGEIAPLDKETIILLKYMVKTENNEIGIMALSILNSNKKSDIETIENAIQNLQYTTGINRATIVSILMDNKKYSQILIPALKSVNYDFNYLVRFFVKKAIRNLAIR